MSLKPLADLFMEDVERVVDKYRDEGITYAEVIGVIELIKIDLYKDARDIPDDEIL